MASRTSRIVVKNPPTRRQPRPINTDPIKYFYDDQTTPQLHGMHAVEGTPLPVSIQGYVGGGQAVGSLAWQAASCAITIGKSVHYMVAHSKKPITKWARTNNLMVLPRAGKDLNAFYDRRSLQFFYIKDPVTGQMVFACESASVVAHELGHALLDIIRPDFWNTQAVEVWAFHEAFGDCNAILELLQHDMMLQTALDETAGDLTKTSVVTRLAKQMGLAAYHFDPNAGYNPNYLRNAANDFKYVAPETLPEDTPDNVLSSESHNFSRVWTGTWWEILAKIQKKLAASMDRLQAFKMARDIAADYLLAATAEVPVTARLFDALARQMLVVDQLRGAPHRDVLVEVFNNRNILLNKVMALSADHVTPESLALSPGVRIKEHACGSKTVHVCKVHTCKMCDHCVQALDDSGRKNPLYEVKIEVPMDSTYHFDKDGALVDFHEADEADAMSAARHCLDYLHRKKLVSKDPKTPFEIKDDSLVRSHICGCCGLSNACDPNAPEYGKGYKGKNNAGCGCCKGDPVCDCDQSSTPTTPPKLGCVTRVKNGGITRYTRGGSNASRRVC